MKGFSILLLPFLFFACEDSEKGDKPLPTKMNGHYLGAYLYEAERIDYLYMSDNYYYFSIKGKCVDKGELFEKYAKQCGDTTYSSFQESLVALSDTINSIHVTCNRAFDADGNKDQNLDDIVSFQFLPFSEFIKDGYTSLQDKKREKSIVEINTTTLVFIESTFGIQFLKTPKDKGEYTFNFSVTCSNGRSLNFELTVDFK